MVKQTLTYALLLSLFIINSCGKNPLAPIYGSGPATFTHTPVAEEFLAEIIPLGGLNPPGHTIPTPHMYFKHETTNLGTSANKKDVFAPASGMVLHIIQPQGDFKVEIATSNTFTYYLDHIYLDSGIHEGSFVVAGQKIGTTSSISHSVDFGVINYEFDAPGLVNKNRYFEGLLHQDSPIKYYTDELKAKLYAKVGRTGPDKDGKFGYDQEGKLIGNWFHESVPNSGGSGADRAYWDKHLAFVYYNKIHDKIMVSIAGYLNSQLEHAYGVQDGALAPENVTPQSGLVVYELYGYNYDTGANNPLFSGVLIVQMMDDETIKVEAFADPGLDSSTVTFTSQAKIYKR